MNFEEEFDKIIKQKVQDHRVSFDHSNWEKAQRMIDAQRAPLLVKKTWSLSKILGIAGVSTAITVSAYFYTRPTNTGITSEKPLDSQMHAPTPVSEKPRLVDISRRLTNELPEAQSSVHPGKNPTSAKPVLKPTQMVVVLHAITPHAALNPNASPETPLNTSSTESTPLPMPINASMAPETENTLPAASNSNQSELTNAPQNLLGTAKENDIANTVSEDQKSNDSRALLPVLQNSLKNSTKPQITSSREITLQPVAYLPLISPSGASQSDTLLKSYIVEPIGLKTESFYSAAKPKSHFLNIGMGMNYCAGWKSNEGVDGRGLNYYMHINYGFYVSRQWNIGAGLDFYNIQNIGSAFYTTQKTEYGFSSTNTYTSVVSDNLKYIGIPLKLSFDVNPNNLITFGVLPSFLVASQNRLDVYKQVNDQTLMLEQSHNKVLYDGIAQKNIQASVGYKVKVCRRFWFQSEFMLGLTDLFSNNASENHTQKPMGIRLGLQYHLFDK
jgi:hypothetical protein